MATDPPAWVLSRPELRQPTSPLPGASLTCAQIPALPPPHLLLVDSPLIADGGQGVRGHVIAIIGARALGAEGVLQVGDTSEWMLCPKALAP